MRDYLKKKTGFIVFYISTFAIFLIVFRLYGLDLEPLLYAGLLAMLWGFVIFIWGYVRYTRKIRSLRQAASIAKPDLDLMPPVEEESDRYYQEMIRKLYLECNDLAVRYQAGANDSLNYYTAWVHQIKTPIAVMQMMLKAEDTQTNRELLSELFRIENYVDMVLTYIRLGSQTNDLVIKEYDLDQLIKKVIRKYAGQFVRCKLSLEYEPVNKTLLTDEKWFGFILEQLISNALKYTYSGGIKISLEGNKLIISDTGIGIAPEDLPRIFEKGYTGYNGRGEAKSTGLGLYLCKTAADKLHVNLLVSSKVKEGSSFAIEWEENPAVIE